MSKKLILVLLLVIPVLVVISGCATIVSKSVYPVIISSHPDGANITVVNNSGLTVFKGKTPSTVKLKAGAGFFKGADYTVTFKKKGYKTYQARIQRGVDGWYVLGNFFIGGVWGWLIVDPATGAMWTLENLYVSLIPGNNVNRENKDAGIRIVTIDEVPKNLRKNLVRIN